MYNINEIKLIVRIGNHKVAPLIKTLLIEQPHTNTEAIIAFFKYWDNCSRVAGVWVDEYTYSFDGCIESPEEGVQISTETVSDLYEEFINIIVFDEFNNNR